MPKKQSTDAEVSAAAASLGRKGGKSGSGDAKRREGDHYSVKLVEARRAAALRRKMQKL